MPEKRSYYANRIPELDMLRGLAILLVLLRHYPVSPIFLQGWIGVDIFFTLSGFLIGGALIREYSKRQSVNVSRFLVRRGLKIYPSFYVFLLLTLILAWVAQRVGKPLYWPALNVKQMLVEVFYLQSFGGGTWPHTWSLAIEEHFYLLLALVVFILTRGKNMIRRLMGFSFAILPICILLRFRICRVIPEFDYIPHYVNTFLRLDSLFFGVFLAGCFHLYQDRMKEISKYIWMSLICVGISASILWLSVFPLEHLDTVRYGYTIIYTSFGAVLFGLMGWRQHSNWFTDQLDRNHPLIMFTVFMGRNSYNIYLWHVLVMQLMMLLAHKYLDTSFFEPMTYYFFAAYFLLSIAIGTVATRMLELPILKWRNRVTPVSDIQMNRR